MIITAFCNLSRDVLTATYNAIPSGTSVVPSRKRRSAFSYGPSRSLLFLLNLPTCGLHTLARQKTLIPK